MQIQIPPITIVEVPRSIYPRTMTFRQATDLVRQQPGVTDVKLSSNSARVCFETIVVTLNHEAPLRNDGSNMDDYLQQMIGRTAGVSWIDTYRLSAPTSDDMYIVKFDIHHFVDRHWPYRTRDAAYLPGTRPASEYGHLSIVEADKIKNLYNIASLKEVQNAR